MGWDSLNLPDYIVKAISDCGLEHPTPIQTAAIPPALHSFSDVLGSAPTVYDVYTLFINFLF